MSERENTSKYPSGRKVDQEPSSDGAPKQQSTESTPERETQEASMPETVDSSEGMSTTVKIIIAVGVLIGGLVVCGIVAFILSVTLVAVNPAQNFESTRNTQRSSDISAILNAVTQYTSETGHSVDTLVEESGFNGEIAICSSTSPSTSLTRIGYGTVTGGDIDLAQVLVSDYIVAIPQDPIGMSGSYTGYSMCITENNRVQIVATETEGGGTNLYVVR